MYITYLKLQNFRNYKDIELFFSPKVNIFWGNNGQGKTNLLEAIHLISTGRSFRTHRLQEMIREGQTHFYIEAHFSKNDILHTLKIYYDLTSKKVTYNETLYPLFSSLLGILPSVFLCPDDLSLISGSPVERRRFLDLHIAQIDPLYLFYLSRYYKAMKQRNVLLRSQQTQTLHAWEQVMAVAAEYLIKQRQQTVAYLQGSCANWMRFFSQEKEIVTLSYCSSSSPDMLATQWVKMRSKEMQYGSTLIGPHRDDLSIKHSNKEIKNFFSEGQKRTCISALRFSQWQNMVQLLGAPPLLCIDDFAVQLDAERQQLMIANMSHFSQVFLTPPHPLTDFPVESKAFYIVDANVSSLDLFRNSL